MIDPSKVLSGLPTALRDELLSTYQEIGANFAEHRWEPSELNGGKFCEVVYSILSGAINGSYPARASKPKNMVDACKSLEGIPIKRPLVGERSLKILIPRMLPPLYEIRNNRGVGHVGGDVNPNILDASAVYGMASWIMAELVRIFHGVSTKEAQDSVEAIIERKMPLIWEIEGTKRILQSQLKMRDQTLLLLYQSPTWVKESDLVKWVEYSSAAMFRTRVLRPLHKERLIEFDSNGSRAKISPAGSKYVEENFLRSSP